MLNVDNHVYLGHPSKIKITATLKSQNRTDNLKDLELSYSPSNKKRWTNIPNQKLNNKHKLKKIYHYSNQIDTKKDKQKEK